MSLAQLKDAITALSQDEKHELYTWLEEQNDDDWDRQMKADAAAGKFDALLRAAEEEHQRGETLPFP